MGLVGPFVAWVGERRAVLIGLACAAIGLLVFGLADTGLVFWAGIPVMALWGFATPATQGLMTRRVAPTEQGQLQGANNSIMGLANLLGPSVFTVSFAYAIGDGRAWGLPGAPFLLAALMMFAAAVGTRHATRERAAGQPAAAGDRNSCSDRVG